MVGASDVSSRARMRSTVSRVVRMGESESLLLSGWFPDAPEGLGRVGAQILQDRHGEVLVAADHQVAVLEVTLRRRPATGDQRETVPAALDERVGLLVRARTLTRREGVVPAALADAVEVDLDARAGKNEAGKPQSVGEHPDREVVHQVDGVVD